MKYLRLLFLLSVLFLGGCQSSYMAMRGLGGYEEKQVDALEWQVSMNVPFKRGTMYASDLCLLHCAEVCFDEGAVGFILKRSEIVRSSQTDKGRTYEFVAVVNTIRIVMPDDLDVGMRSLAFNEAEPLAKRIRKQYKLLDMRSMTRDLRVAR